MPPVFLHHIETLVPPGKILQSDFAKVQNRFLKNPKLKRIAKKIYQDSGVHTRYSVIVEPGEGVQSSFYSLGKNRQPYEPSTLERNNVYGQAGALLGVQASKNSLEKSPFQPSQITHLITVSCTGFTNPGADLRIIESLRIPFHIERYNLGFMGCYAAFPALKMADQFCRANPEAVVLMVCIELCSLHFQFKENIDTILANSLFSDGVAAALVSAKKPAPGSPYLQLRNFSSALILNGINDMAWNVGDKGFDIVLSKYVPRIIGENIGGLVEEILEKNRLSKSQIRSWAVHPGGKSILDKFQAGLKLNASHMEPSRKILREYGNMSAATIFFVLKTILEEKEAFEQPVFAAAFGPGLTVESALMVKKND